jgi:hypothetical protein
LWTILTSRGDRHELLCHGWKEVQTVFLIALILDSIYQFLVHGGNYTLELLLAVTILALVPYVAFRGVGIRLVRRRSAVSPSDEQPGNRGN